MYRAPRIVVAIPAFLADATIAPAVQTLLAFVDTLIVVDDGWRILERYAPLALCR